MRKLFLLLVVGSSAVARAQAPDPDTTVRHFLIMASIGNLQEVNAGNAAAQKSTPADIKAFGQMMIADHGAAEQKLLQLAKDRKIELPDAATRVPPEDLNLKKATGADFDRMYLHAMFSGHAGTVMMFQNYAVTGKDPIVKAWAQQMLPKLKGHLEAIKVLNEKYKSLSAN